MVVDGGGGRVGGHDYRTFFNELNGFAPYGFQVAVADRLAERRNVVLRAPTGAGKTRTVLTPFFYPGWSPRPTRLIYAVPLRTLAQGIYREAREMARAAGFEPDQFVRMQTGEQPDDPFFSQGRIIVTTYDQVLSGLLSGPYGLSPRLHNINSAAVAGALVVFDEFHLMEPGRAFLTGAAGLHMFRDLTQSVWMTATATSPLLDTLAEALGAVDASPSTEEVLALPMVSGVDRQMAYSGEPLTAARVLEASDGRTIVICNTVPRAQGLFEQLRGALPSSVPVTLLHSRFFKPDRDAKVASLKELFGKGRGGRAVLVATQVVEAGIDISCDDLHTELCPVNALVQRAGRCARYPGESGTVHVYQPGSDERAWLPYGGLSGPEPAFEATARLLEGLPPEPVSMTPAESARWVQEVHAQDDRGALKEGWIGRLRDIHRVVHRNSIERSTVRIAQYIREESISEVRVLVADEASLPPGPGACESVTISRWQLRRLFDLPPGDTHPFLWEWHFGNRGRDEPSRWEAVTDPDRLLGAFIVCLAPSVARYTSESGLVLGEAGSAVSPPRAEIRRPGHSPGYRSEPWSDHARAVAAAAVDRAAADGIPGWLALGFQSRFGLTPDETRSAVEASGLLHDLGKLQTSWQDWAEAWQRARHPGYQHVVGLAHTDFDPDDPEDVKRERSFSPRRPAHATASAFAGLAVVPGLLHIRADLLPQVASSCLAAVASHHGAWLPSETHLGIERLWRRWVQDVRDARIENVEPAMMDANFAHPDRRALLSSCLDITTTADTMGGWWPLVAYLIRTLRLADQRATSEGTAGD